MSQCNCQSLLGTYHDRELDRLASREVELHVQDCELCAAELAFMRGISARIADIQPPEITLAELARIHDAIDQAAEDQPGSLSLMPTMRFLGALAASILIISAVWLLDLRARPEVVGPSTATLALAPEWEHIAVTLHADPRLTIVDDSLFSPRFALAVEWMLDSLTPLEPKPWVKPS